MFAAHQHLAGLTNRQLIPVLVGHHDFGKEEGFTAGFRFSNRILRVHEAGRAAGFGEAIYLRNVDAHVLISLCQGNRYRRSTGHKRSHARPVVVLKVGHLNHEIQHGRYHQSACYFFSFDAFPRRHRIKAAHDVGCGAMVGIDGQRREGADVEHGETGNVALAGLIICGRVNGEYPPHGCRVGVNDTLGKPCSPRGVHDVQHVIVFGSAFRFSDARCATIGIVGGRKRLAGIIGCSA